MVDARRVWIVGAGLEYTRVVPDEWADRLVAIRDAGFNTVVTSCPWRLHEPREGAFAFGGAADVAGFMTHAHELGLRVAVRLGPTVGSGFAFGGLPGWLADDRSIRPREASERLLRALSRYYQELLGRLADLQVTRGGPILLAQLEHGWCCGNTKAATAYLGELLRIVRENGIDVPLLNANDLWQAFAGTIDTWRGWDDLLAHLRQLRDINPEAPRIVSTFDAAGHPAWGDDRSSHSRPPGAVMHRFAQILAAGAQPMVTPFHGGTNFGISAGREPGAPGRFLTTAAAAAAPLGEAGARGRGYMLLRRIATFAGTFGHVFADLDPDLRPAMIDPDHRPTRRTKSMPPTLAVTTATGAGGSAVFVFAGEDDLAAETTLLLGNGMRLPIAFEDQPVGWYVTDVDLDGSGRLDYANLCPFALIDRRILVLYGPPKTPAYLSIDDSPLEATVPTGAKPVIIRHKKVTIVICNTAQIDACLPAGDRVHVGASGLDDDGAPIADPALGALTTITATDDASSRTTPGRTSRPRPINPTDWTWSRCDAQVDGTAARYATLPGPTTLQGCGAYGGYGWYRIAIRRPGAGKVRIMFPDAGDRLRLYANGEFVGILGVGPEAIGHLVDVRLVKGDNILVVLAEDLGGFDGGNDLPDPKGIFNPPCLVKTLRVPAPKRITADPVDPFALRAYIEGLGDGQASAPEQLAWTFTHAKKAPIIVDVADASASGTFVLNDVPIAYFAGRTGATMMQLVLDPASASFKRGRNVLRFAPDIDVHDDPLGELAKAVKFHECTDVVSDGVDWRFARWEPPAPTRFTPVPARAAGLATVPAWMQTTFSTPRRRTPALWLDTSTLTKGRAMMNGFDLGRYYASTTDGKAVGPQTRLYVPRSTLRPERANDLVIFDEQGALPHKVRLVYDDKGDLD